MKQQHQPSDRPANAAPRWRSALDALIGAPVRLHRYRHLHAEVIEDALRAFDSGPERGPRR
jgi:uncharacterized protein (DUF2237 family)